MAREKKIVWSLDAHEQKLNQKLDQLSTKFDKTGGKGFDAFKLKLAAGITAAYLAMVRLVNVVSEYVSLSEKQLAAETKTAQAVKSTGQAAGFTAEELNNIAANLQKITAIGDEDILRSVTTQLLTFTNITGENFLRTQQAAIDVATVLSKDLLPNASELQAISIQLGKALNDPVANLGALSRSGIQFSKQQKEQIKLLAETNRLAEAQTIILDELNKQYGGQAKAVADSVGQLKKAENSFTDLKETIGGLIRGGLIPGAEAFTKITDSINDYLKVPLSEKTEQERIDLNSLVTAIRLANDNQDLRNRLIEELNQKYPFFLQNIKTEELNNKNLKDRLDEVNNAFKAKILLQIAESDIQNDLQKVYDANIKQQRALKDALKEFSAQTGTNLDDVDDLNEALDIMYAYARQNNLEFSSLAVSLQDYDDATKAINSAEKNQIENQKERNIILEKYGALIDKIFSGPKNKKVVDGLNEQSDALKDYVFNLKNARDELQETLRTIDQEFENADFEKNFQKTIDQALKAYEDLKEKRKQEKADFEEHVYDMSNLAQSLGDALASGISTGNLKDSLKNILKTLISFLEKELIAATIKSLLDGVIGIPLGIGKIVSATALLEGLKGSIDSFRAGVDQYSGGIVKVHQDELVTNLPKGSNVFTKTETAGLLDIKPLISEIRALRKDVQVLQGRRLVITPRGIVEMIDRENNKKLSN